MELSKLLRDQKQELEESVENKKIIDREVEDFFKHSLKSKLTKVITGVRRCGKSVFAFKALKGKNFAYMNFDDERLPSLEAGNVLPAFYEVYGKNFKFIFLDEIQNLDKWELLVNRLHRIGFNLFITGSNSKLLSRELATHLTGRHIEMEVFPFSFREYLTAADFKEDIETSKGASILKHELKNYLKQGGFPEIVVEKENPAIYARELYRKIIERDIIDRHDIKYKKTFKEITLAIISNPAKSVSFNKIKKQFSLGSEQTAKNYLSYLEEAYLIFSVSRFSFKPVEIEKSMKKIYVIDPAIINNVTIKFSTDKGGAHENVIALELLRQKAFNPETEIYYWKNIKQEEVDFVVKKGLKVKQLIQACFDISDYAAKEREVKALIKASKELKCNDLLVITWDYENKEKIKEKIIKFKPLWKWLLEAGNEN